MNRKIEGHKEKNKNMQLFDIQENHYNGSVSMADLRVIRKVSVFMKKAKLFLIAGAMGLMVTGCGQGEQKAVEPTVEIQESTEHVNAADDSENTETAVNTKETTQETKTLETESSEQVSETQTKGTEEKKTDGTYEENFAVDSEAAAEFGRQIKEAVAAKDLEKLADLTAFPIYAGFPEGGQSVESKEVFLNLGADKIFNQELMDSIAAADETNLNPSMAGFVLTKESGAPNIIFGVRDGVLAVSGINY